MIFKLSLQKVWLFSKKNTSYKKLEIKLCYSLDYSLFFTEFNFLSIISFFVKPLIWIAISFDLGIQVNILSF